MRRGGGYPTYTGNRPSNNFITGDLVMLTNRFHGPFSRVAEDGVYCVDDAGEERQVFTWKESEDGTDPTVPILSKVDMTRDKVDCYWAKNGYPCTTFEREKGE